MLMFFVFDPSKTFRFMSIFVDTPNQIKKKIYEIIIDCSANSYYDAPPTTYVYAIRWEANLYTQHHVPHTGATSTHHYMYYNQNNFDKATFTSLPDAFITVVHSCTDFPVTELS